jgi:hypothetical protein
MMTTDIALDSIPQLVLPKGKSKDRIPQLIEFSNQLVKLAHKVGFPVSARGWDYLFENMNLITKNQFDHVENLIKEGEKCGYIPVDVLAKDEGRAFDCVEEPTDCTPVQYVGRWLGYVQQIEWTYHPDWWEGERYYVQTVVEKIDLKTLFLPISKKFHIPIATAGGWQNIFQRAEYGRRFKEAEERGLQSILLYGGDYDPGDSIMARTLRKNLEDVKHITWMDGTSGYDPKNLIIERFALTRQQIDDLHLTWIDNLITGNKNKKMDLADPKHPQHNWPHVQNWLKTEGARKCESNALVVHPEKAREIYENAILFGGKNKNWQGLGADALDRFASKRAKVVEAIREFRELSGLDAEINNLLRFINGEA